jgi:hypothetical protein
MARGSSLSELEKGKILAYKDVGMSSRSIATKLNRSKTVVNNFLINPSAYCLKNQEELRGKYPRRRQEDLCGPHPIR